MYYFGGTFMQLDIDIKNKKGKIDVDAEKIVEKGRKYG